MENIVRKGEIACNKQFLLFSQCFLLYVALIFHFKCTLNCRLQFVSIWTSLKFCCLVMVEIFTKRQNSGLDQIEGISRQQNRSKCDSNIKIFLPNDRENCHFSSVKYRWVIQMIQYVNPLFHRYSF